MPKISIIVPIYNAYEFTEAFLNSCGEYFKFEWTKSEATEFNSTLANYLSVDSTKLKLTNKPSEIYKSYTLEPVKVGNYYFLMIKLQDFPQNDLFKENADGEYEKDENGNYIINDQAVYDEIIAKHNKYIKNKLYKKV